MDDKVHRVLWNIWLRAGPLEGDMRRYLSSVRIFVTDMGTEIGLADIEDYLPSFYQWLRGEECTRVY